MIVMQCTIAGKDFTFEPVDTLFRPYSTPDTRCYYITIIDDSVPENSMQFKINISTRTRGVILPPENALVIVVDDDRLYGVNNNFTVMGSALGVVMALFLAMVVLIAVLAFLIALRRKR